MEILYAYLHCRRFKYTASLSYLSFQAIRDITCYIHTTCRCLGKGMCHAAAIADDIKSFVTTFQVLVYVYFHVVELNFYTIKQSVIICSSRCYLIQGIDHFDDAI